MAVLVTVGDFIAQARVLLLDQVDSPYRYPDDDLVTGLNLAFGEIFRLRPDLIFSDDYAQATPAVTSSIRGLTAPTYSSASPSTTVAISSSYKMAVLFFIVGFAQLRDSEDVQDARASAFMNKFTSQLLQVMA